MTIFDKFFNKNKNNTANLAKERLLVVVNKDKNHNPLLDIIEEELISSIKKYISITATNVEASSNIDEIDFSAELEKANYSKEEVSFFLRLFNKKNNSANLAKERLKIIIKSNNKTPEFYSKLKMDIDDIISRNVSNKSTEKVDIYFDENTDGLELLSINVNLTEKN